MAACVPRSSLKRAGGTLVWNIRRRTTDVTAMTMTLGNNKDNRVLNPVKSVQLSDENWNKAHSQIKSTSIPQPPGLPVLGNVRDFVGSFGSTAHTFLQNRADQMGPIYQFSALGEKMVFLFSYKEMKQLRQAEGKFPEHIEFRHLMKYRKEKGLPLGVLISTGEEWAKQRRALAATMLRPDVVPKYVPGLHKVAEDAIRYHVNKQRHGESVDAETLAGKYALEGIGRAVLGMSLGCFEEDDRRYLQRFVYFARRNFQDARQLLIAPDCMWCFMPAWERHNEGWNYILDVARYHVDSQIANWTNGNRIPKDCILGALHSSGKMSRDELYVNIADVLLAAIDTTSSVILWTLYELSRHPDVQETLFRELRSNQGREPMTYKQLFSLKYLRAVLKESLRLHPVAFFSSRITQHNTVIRGYQIPSKTHVACSMYVMGRDRTLFPEPELFRPERWLGDRNPLGPFFSTVPFGSGVRMCLGRRIAETEILLFLLEMCKTYRIEAESTTPIEPTFRILMVPKTPLRIKFIPREF